MNAPHDAAINDRRDLTTIELVGLVTSILGLPGSIVAIYQIPSLKHWWDSLTKLECWVISGLILAVAVIGILLTWLKRASRLSKSVANSASLIQSLQNELSLVKDKLTKAEVEINTATIYRDDFRSRSRICILIPEHQGANDDIKSDVCLILNGVGRALSTLSKQITCVINIDLRYYKGRHEQEGTNKEPEMHKVVRDELRKGTRYFICTTTEACRSLSGKFSDILKSADVSDAILVCTLASGGGIATQRNRIYRFFPDAAAEGAELARETIEFLAASNKDVRKLRAAAISTDSTYGHALRSGFETAWTRDGRGWIEIPQLDNNKHTEIRKKILDIGNDWSQYGCDLIFLSGTKKALLAILKPISELYLRPELEKRLLVVSSAFDPFDSSEPDDGQTPQTQFWESLPMICCRPKLTKNGDTVRGSIVEFYVANSVLKLIDSITALSKAQLPITKFDDAWSDATRPRNSIYDKGFWAEQDRVIPMVSIKSPNAIKWVGATEK